MLTKHRFLTGKEKTGNDYPVSNTDTAKSLTSTRRWGRNQK